MPRLSDSLSRIAALRSAMETASGSPASDRLTTVSPLACNPGELVARCYVPPGLSPGAPLVVALHGCTQSAVGYDHGTGWSTLADRAGFAVLFPEQARGNNPNLCFNWFQARDIARAGGEAESIAAMTRAMVARHGLDPARVYVTGLSAGGAMTAAMLATYPDLFAGGAIIGGLPYGCADGVQQAMERMRGGVPNEQAAIAAVERAADGHATRWPSVSIWHGSADATVAVANLDALGRQWRGVHGIAGAADLEEAGANWSRRGWRAADGRVLVEEWRVADMGHGVPIATTGPDAIGEAGPYMLDVGLSSTLAIARSWGLVDETRQAVGVAGRLTRADAATPAPSTRPPVAQEPGGVQAVIEKALRAAGLMS